MTEGAAEAGVVEVVEPPSVVRLDPRDIGVTAAALARAFADDPLTAYLFPHTQQRHERLCEMFAPVLRYGLKYGEVYTNPGKPVGAAVWVPPPGRRAVSVERLFEAGMHRAMWRGGFTAAFRAFMSSGTLQGLDPMSIREANWYLWLLGVAPEAQSRGLGGSLVREVLGRADEAGAPCCLETSTERNVRFYGRLGFNVTASGCVPFRGPRVWTMTRPAAPIAGAPDD